MEYERHVDNISIASKKINLSLVKNVTGIDLQSNFNKALLEASKTGHLQIVKFLTEQGANVQTENNWSIIYASSFGHLEIVKFLAEHGADNTAGNNKAIQLASTNNHLEIVRYLISIVPDWKAKLDALKMCIPEHQEIIKAEYTQLEMLHNCSLMVDSKINDSDRQCIICLTNERIVAFQCGHKKMCAKCTQEIILTTICCPVCREKITKVIRIFD